VAGRQPGGGDVPHRRPGQRDTAQPGPHQGEGEAGEHGDPQADGDEGLDGVVVVAAEGDAGLEAGPDDFKVPLSVTIIKGRSTIEPGLVPARNLTLTFKSFTDAADSAGMSRRYGGIHFEGGDLNGRTLGSQIGSQAWTKAQAYFNGTATGP
jgi:hypothetical protein